MSSSRVTRLLKKKGWTGKEVGQLLIASMLNDIKQLGQEEKTPLFTQAEFENIENTLNTEKDFLTYGVYRDLYSSIIDSYNRGQGIFQQFFNGFSRFFSELQLLERAEEAQGSMDETPLIMTESQYNRLKTEAAARIGEEKHSFCFVFFWSLETLIAMEENGEPIDSAVEAAIKDTRKQPGEQSQLYKRYHEFYNTGYYTLEDGSRSDQLQGTEWEDALEKAYLETHKLTVNGKRASNEKTIKYFREKAFVKAQELYYHGAEATRAFVTEKTGEPCTLTDEQIEHDLSSLINMGGGPFELALSCGPIAAALEFVPKATWTKNTDPPPAGLTLHDFLELYIDEWRAGKEKETLQAFKKDCPALFDALKAYIEKTVPELCGLKPNQLYKDIISAWKLESSGLIGYENYTEPADSTIISVLTGHNPKTTEEHRKTIRGENRGIAIIREPYRWQVDKNGDYKESKSPLSYFGSIDTLAEDETRKEELKGYSKYLIYPAMSYLYAYNALMEILAEVYDLPELKETARIKTKDLEGRMEAFNSFLHGLYYGVYGTEADKKRKREIIKEALYELDYEQLKPTEEAIAEVTKELEALGISSNARKRLKYLDKFITALETIGKGAL